MIGLFLGDTDFSDIVLSKVKKLKKNELVKDVLNFIEKDKKRPICTPYSK